MRPPSKDVQRHDQILLNLPPAMGSVYTVCFTFSACLRAPSSLSFTICSRQPSRYLKSPDNWFLSALANFVPCTPQMLQMTRQHMGSCLHMKATKEPAQ